MAFSMFGRTIRKIGVIGSGRIGPDIALHLSQSFHSYGVPVVVVDIAQAALDAALKKAESKMAKAVEKKAFKKEESDAILKNMLFTADYGSLKEADLVIEAVFEELDLKQKIFERCEAICPKTAILASNSSHLPPEEVFQKIKDKNRCLVIHYFFPADRNLLVEIVPGKETDASVTNFCTKLYEFAGKVPVKVKSRYGYAVNPIFEGLLLAGTLIVAKGLATVKQVDAIETKALGMGVGSFTAHNLAGGSDLTQKGLTELHKKVMKWYHPSRLLDDQVKSGKPWDAPAKGESVEYSPETYQAVSDRLMGVYFGMASEIVDSGIATLSDLELALDLGLDMRAPFEMMNKLGVKKALELVDAYARENEGFKVSKILSNQAALGKTLDDSLVLREDKGDIAIVTIRRPKVLNALNLDVFNQLEEIFAGIDNDAKIRGAVLTGFGTRAFVSGADIGMLAAQKTSEEAEANCLKNQASLNRIAAMTKPVVCAMNGLAFGGGNELAMTCTVRIAKKGQKVFVAQPEPRLGIIPGVGGTQRLPRLIGIENALSMLRSGNPISSSRAKEIGLIYEEVDGDVVEVAVALVKIMSGEVRIPPIRKDPFPVPGTLPEVDIGPLSRKIDSLIQKAVLGGAKTTLEEGLKLEAKTFGECLKTKDMRIGMDNFVKNGPRVNAPFVHE